MPLLTSTALYQAAPMVFPETMSTNPWGCESAHCIYMNIHNFTILDLLFKIKEYIFYWTSTELVRSELL
jgi:hypothetical protein